MDGVDSDGAGVAVVDVMFFGGVEEAQCPVADGDDVAVFKRVIFGLYAVDVEGDGGCDAQGLGVDLGVLREDRGAVKLDGVGRCCADADGTEGCGEVLFLDAGAAVFQVDHGGVLLRKYLLSWLGIAFSLIPHFLSASHALCMISVYAPRVSFCFAKRRYSAGRAVLRVRR